MSGCPTRDELAQLLAPESSPDSVEVIAAHVETCPHCREVLAELTDDPELAKWHGLLRKKDEARPTSDFLRRLKDTPPDPPPLTRHEDEVEAISFPGEPTPKGPLGQLGPYHIRRQFAAGAFGFLFEAVDSLDRTVAIKVLRPEFAASIPHRTRFNREVRTAAAVRHENIVTIHEVGDTPEFPLPYFVMEYVDGESLSARMDRLGLPTPNDAARIIRDVARGLDAAHTQNVVHRDIKPTNVMLERATGRVKITDFGLARSIEEINELISGAGRMIGTPAYMSPEQIATPASVDQRTDIFSLGVVLYELLTGERPFLGVSPQVLEHIVHDDPLMPRRLNKAIPRDLQTICLKAIEKEPAQRYQTAQAFAEDLDRFLKGEPISARPVPTWERGVKWMRRRPAVTSLLAALVVVVVTAFVLITWKWQDAEYRRQQAEQERERADRNFAWARAAVEETATKLLSDQQFREGPYQKLHEDLLTSATAFYDDVAQQTTNDPLFQADRAKIYWRRGFVRGLKGQREQALADYRKMEEIFRDVLTASPDDPIHRGWLAWSLCSQGNMLRDMGRLAEAEPLFTSAIDALEQLHEKHPDRPEVIVLLAATRMNRGKLAYRRDQFDEAVDWHQQALKLLELLPGQSGEVELNRIRFLAETYDEHARALVRLTRWREAASALERLIVVRPDEPRGWYDCAIAHLGADDLPGYQSTCRKMMDRFRNTSDPQVAERLLYACLPGKDAVADSRHLVPLAERTVAYGEWNRRLWGASLCRSGRPSEAVAAFQRVKAAGPLRGWDLCFLAMAHHAAGRPDEAIEVLSQARNWTDDMLKADHDATGQKWGWTEMVETVHLRREAETLIAGRPSAQR